MDTHTNTSMGMSTPTPIKNGNTPLQPWLYLLHISDPMLPIGGFTHSYGLETYVQKELVNSSEAAAKYLECYLRHNYLYNDLLAMRLAWEFTEAGNMDGIVELNNILCASKLPEELRNAGTKLGLRLIKILEKILEENDFFREFMEAVKAEKCESNYSVVFGIAAFLMNAARNEAMCAVTYSTASAIINNCAKLIPISQMDGQKILFQAHGTIEEIIETACALGKEELGVSGTGFDIRSMQHERLYTRIYIS